MLKPAAIALVACVLSAGAARAATPPGLVAPERLTTGSSDELLGELAPDGHHLYFVSNRSSTSQIFVQDLSTGLVAPLFDEASDVSWPRVSPDGTQLLYLSFRDDAAGDLCVRDLATLTRRCLADPTTAALAAAWLPDGKILLDERRGLDGDLRLCQVTLAAGRLTAEPLARTNLSSPALSPDGRWLASVPIAKSSVEVGVGFAARAARAIDLYPLGGQSVRASAPIALSFRLPGVSSQPRFSQDGRWLYFTQYLNDTNFDGVIDGNDHGVLFRVRFDARARQPVAASAEPEQLTLASWNCQYPAPAKSRLIATCAESGSLDVYSLPLAGAIPESFDVERLRAELGASDDPWEELLLDGRLLALEPAGPAQVATLFAVLGLHLRLGEYESAAFYAKEVPDPALRQAVLELTAHRRAERALDRGELSNQFVADSRARIARLEPAPGASADAVALCAIARSEVADTIGDEGLALSALKSVAVDDHTSPFVLGLWADRARAEYRKLDDRAALLEVYRRLAAHPALDEADRLEYADAFVHELARGRSGVKIDQLQTELVARADSDSELGFMLALEGQLLELAPGKSEAVRKGIFELYRRHRSFERRRALVGETVARAAAVDDDYLLYQFANTYVSGVPRDSAERARAEALYRQVVLERAYIEQASGRKSDARGDFYGVTLQTDSPEAWVGFLELRLAEHKDAARELATRFATRPNEPIYRFARAYLRARELGHLDGAEAAKAESDAIADLQLAKRGLTTSFEVEQLWGTVLHQRFLRAGRREDAEAASTHYLLALDLARDNPRYRATLLEELGRLQAAVGNFRLALASFEERDKLPFDSRELELGHRLAEARCQFHLDREKEAAALADRALELLSTRATLARFRPLALDRAALYHLAAGDSGKARTLYGELLPLVEKLPGEEGARNRLVARIGRAAAALGTGDPKTALADLGLAEQLLDGPARAAVAEPHQALSEVRASYRLILSGLSAEAYRALGRIADAERQMEARRSELVARLSRDQLDEDRLSLAIVEAHLAEYAHARKDDPAAVRHLEAALGWSDAFSQKTGTPIHEVGLALLEGYAALHVTAGVPLSDFKLDLRARLESAYAILCARRNPAWAGARARFATDLTLLQLDGSK